MKARYTVHGSSYELFYIGEALEFMGREEGFIDFEERIGLQELLKEIQKNIDSLIIPLDKAKEYLEVINKQ